MNLLTVSQMETGDLQVFPEEVTLQTLVFLAEAMVSNDSGAMHLAGAVGAKVVAIFGASNERRTSPLRSSAEAPEPAIIVVMGAIVILIVIRAVRHR